MRSKVILAHVNADEAQTAVIGSQYALKVTWNS